MSEPAFKGWAILELMGHRKRPGFVEEVEIGGGKMLRVDIHGKDGDIVTEFYGCSAVYCLRPVSEEIARDAGEASNLRPVRPAEYAEPRRLSSLPALDEGDDDMPF